MYSICRAKEEIKNAVRGYLLKDENGNYLMNEVNRLPLYLIGPPGLGKTQITSQTASELGIGFVSFSITHHSRNTVLGLPVIEAGPQNQKYTEYTMSEIIAKVKNEYESGQKEGILLLDEFNCMAETLLPIMLAFLQTKNIGAHALPEGWVLILCGNPGKFNRSARTFDAAIMDRVRKLDLEFDHKDFLKYASDHHFEPVLAEFLKVNPQACYVIGTEDRTGEIATPRSWENLDCALKMYKRIGATIDADMIGQFIKSEKIAKGFAKFYDSFDQRSMNAADFENILKGLGLDKYIEVFIALDRNKRMNITDNLFAMLENATSTGSLTPKKIVIGVESILTLVMGTGDPALTSRAYAHINNNVELLTALSKVKCPKFLELCKNACYFDQAS
ncbi:MAG: AAA family ATPase [Lachnospiraceae bacterium]|nr:AAA family ATPase [Lachnospiraceae bacterium]